MIRIIPCLIIVLLSIGCGGKPGPTKARAEKDPKLTAVEDRIAKTTPEGKAVIEKAQAMKPEVNEQPSTKTLAEIVEDLSKNKSNYNMSVIGWEASQKKNNRWKIVLDFWDWEKKLLAAEWEYNPETNKLYPFEFTNAPGFWSSEGAKDQPKDAKGKKK